MNDDSELRDMLALVAMHGMLSNHAFAEEATKRVNEERVPFALAEISYKMADAMLPERVKKGPTP